MKLFVIILFFLSLIATIIGYYRSLGSTKPKVEYRYINKNINEVYKSDEVNNIYQKFKNMFVQPSILS